MAHRAATHSTHPKLAYRVALAAAGLAIGTSAARAVAPAVPNPPPATQPLPDSATADIDDDMRFVPTTRPALPVPQFPPAATTQNTDTGKPPQEWQRLTDDWFGVRPWLDDHGLSVNGSVELVAGQNLLGGVRTDHGGLGDVVNLNLTLDTAKLFGWPAGSFFVNAQSENGLTHSLDGAYQSASDIYNEDRSQISEIWYQQELLDGRVRLRAGKIDANTQFDVPENGDEFLNDSAGFSPTILGFPTNPDPAFGVTAFVYPADWCYAGAGAFDGSTQAGRSTGGRGPATLFHGDGGAFLIGEAGLLWKLSDGTLPGRVAVGVWHHTGAFERFNGTRDLGATGPYLRIDQAVYRSHPHEEDDERGLGLFFSCGYADPSISVGTLSAVAGFAWTGVGEARPDDVVGVSVDYLKLSDHATTNADSETVIEAFYKVQVLKWLSVKPDLQGALFPAEAKNDAALIAAVQVVADF